MNIALLVGKNAPIFAKTVNKSMDNVDFFEFKSMSDLIKESKLRQLELKRIIVAARVLKEPEKELKDLNDFIKEFSSNTEVVCFMKPEDVGGIDMVFNRIFNAPMYSPVVFEKANSKLMISLVADDILKIRTELYDNVAGVSVGKQEEKPTEPAVEEPKVQEVAKTVPEAGRERRGGFGFGPKAVDIENMGTKPTEEGRGSGNYDEVSFVNYEGSGVGGNADLGPEIYGDDDDDLSIGDYGSSHSDTGYLDADEGDELQAYLNNREGKKEEEVKVVEEEKAEEVYKGVEVRRQREDDTKYKESKGNWVSDDEAKEYGNEMIETGLNIDLVVSTGSVRSTQAMIDEALNLYRKDDAKVLIIDLDTKRNRVLSLLKTGEFYRTNCFDGITKQRVYVEDHIGICSNGYGSIVTTKDLKALLSGRLVKKYDLILIDCPVDCLNVIDNELVRMCHVLVYVGNTLTDMVDMSTGLTDRSVVRLGVEQYVMGNCDVEVVGGSFDKGKVKSFKDACLFANGCWLDRL